MFLKRSLRFLAPKVHGILDYSAALALVVLPAQAGWSEISPLATGFSVTLGAVLATYSLLTDSCFGIFPVISHRMHTVFDLLLAIVLMLVPAVFAIEGSQAGYFWLVAAGVVLGAAITAPGSEVFPCKGRPAGRFSDLRS